MSRLAHRVDKKEVFVVWWKSMNVPEENCIAPSVWIAFILKSFMVLVVESVNMLVVKRKCVASVEKTRINVWHQEKSAPSVQKRKSTRVRHRLSGLEILLHPRPLHTIMFTKNYKSVWWYVRFVSENALLNDDKI